MDSILGPLPEDPKPFKWDTKKLIAQYNEQYGIDEPEEPEPVYKPGVKGAHGDAEMTFREIAAEIGLSESAVKLAYRTGMKKLRERCHIYDIDRSDIKFLDSRDTMNCRMVKTCGIMRTL